MKLDIRGPVLKDKSMNYQKVLLCKTCRGYGSIVNDGSEKDCMVCHGRGVEKIDLHPEVVDSFMKGEL
jgi:DnaJ-class molecular chaperone